jgi:hypothetical protein
MRIDSNLSIGTVDAVRGKTIRPAADQASTTDATAFSAFSRDLQTALDALKSVPEVREDEVAALKAQRAEGTLLGGDDALLDKLLGSPRP